MKNLTRIPILFLVLFSQIAIANNVRVSNVLRLDAGGAKDEISFELSWDNSWSVGGTPGNHDAVWVFVKFRECGVGGTWIHGLVDVNMASHSFASTVTYADTVSLYDRNGVLPAGATVSNGLGNNTGILIKRSSIGVGNITSALCTLKLVNPTTQLDPAVTYDIRVFGIEMVQVLTEGFPIGDGISDSSFTPTSVDSEDPISAGVLYTGSAALPAEYPKGFQKFYCMKYEISQGQYAHFLNHASISGGSPMNYYNSNRNMLGPGGFGAESITPATAQNYMGWNDLLAYLDWAALRPLTELEYEKVCLGPPGGGGLGSYAWGTATYVKAWMISSDVEDGTETVLTHNANANIFSSIYMDDDNLGMGGDQRVSGSATCSMSGVYEWYGVPASGYWDDDAPFEPVNDGSCDKFLTVFPFYYPTASAYTNLGFGPVGVGIFARDTTLTRITTGGSYYGAMELSGNVSEQCVSVVSTNYEGTWGNGYLSGGQADNADWPGGVNGFTVRAIRGGGYGSLADRMRVCDRYLAESTLDNREGNNSAVWYRAGDVGGRGAR